MSGLSVKSFYNKSAPYIPPHLRKKNHSDVECQIVDFDISDTEEKDEEKLDEIQDIKSQVQEHEEVGSSEEQESEDDKTLDEHLEREEWSESSESADLSDDNDLTISRNKRYTKEDPNKKIKENFLWHKRELPVVGSTFHGKAFPDPPLTEISPYMYFKQFFDDDLFKHIADQTVQTCPSTVLRKYGNIFIAMTTVHVLLNLIKTMINYLKYDQLLILSLINASQCRKKKCSR